jgi:hypothetical protein
VRLAAPSLCPENLVRACASSPEISRGGHGILPSHCKAAVLRILALQVLAVESGVLVPPAHRGAWRLAAGGAGRKGERGAELALALTQKYQFPISNFRVSYFAVTPGLSQLAARSSQLLVASFRTSYFVVHCTNSTRIGCN